MTLPKVKYTQTRGGRYHLQLPIPKLYQSDLEGMPFRDTTLKGKTARCSLGTADPRQAELEVAKARAELQHLVERVEAMKNLDELVDTLPPEQRRVFDDAGSIDALQEEFRDVQKAREGKKTIALLQEVFRKNGSLAPISEKEQRRRTAEVNALDAAMQAEVVGIGKTLRALGQEVDLQGEVFGLRELAHADRMICHASSRKLGVSIALQRHCVPGAV